MRELAEYRVGIGRDLLDERCDARNAIGGGELFNRGEEFEATADDPETGKSRTRTNLWISARDGIKRDKTQRASALEPTPRGGPVDVAGRGEFTPDVRDRVADVGLDPRHQPRIAEFEQGAQMTLSLVRCNLFDCGKCDVEHLVVREECPNGGESIYSVGRGFKRERGAKPISCTRTSSLGDGVEKRITV